jgi:Putative peptidoglycan binding domain
VTDGDNGYLDEDLDEEPEPAGGRWRLTRRRWLVLGTAAVAVAGTGVGIAVAMSGDTGPGASAAVPTGEARVVRTTLNSSQQVAGSLGYLNAYTVTLPGGLPAASAGSAGATSQSQASGAAAQLAGAEKAVSDARTLAAQQLAAARNAVANDQLMLAVDQGQEKADNDALTAAKGAAEQACAGSGATTPECASAKQNVTTLTGKVSADGAAVSRDRATLTADSGKVTVAQAQGQQSVDTAQAQADGYEGQLKGAQQALAATATTTLAGHTITQLAAAGSTVNQGEPLYWLDGVPAPLLLGDQTAYRAFTPGMTDGADVTQLQQDLIALNLGSGVQRNGHFDAATESGVKALQQRLGTAVTGSLGLGQFAFVPVPVRITNQVVAAGAQAQPGAALLTATSTTRAVIVPLPVSQENLVHAGDKVTIDLPDGKTTTPGRVSSVSTVASAQNTPGGGNSNPNGGTGNGNGQNSVTAQQQAANTTVPVTISLDNPSVAGVLDQAPVTVEITDQSARDVLAVPVQALIALADGGYGLQLTGASGDRVVPVTTGLFGGGLVQVSGAGITAGTVVQVPAA